MLRHWQHSVFRSGIRVGVCALIAACAIVLRPASADCLPILSVHPSTTTTDVGTMITLNIVIGETDPGPDDDAVDLFAYQFGLSFDPTILQAILVSPGTFFGNPADTGFVPGVIDNENGGIAFNANTLIGPIPGVSGSGSLLSVQFLAIAAGIATIAPVLDPALNDLFLDSAFNIIEPTIRQGSVTVTAPSAAVPEPATLLLTVMGCGLVALRHRRLPRGGRSARLD